MDSKVASDADRMVIWRSWDEKYQILGWSFATARALRMTRGVTDWIDGIHCTSSNEEFVGNPLGELVGTGGKAFSAMLCFMFALVHRDDA